MSDQQSRRPTGSVLVGLSSADALVGAAKSDFPSETSAITNAVDRLSKSARQLSSSPKVTIAAMPAEIGAAVAAVNNFASATSS